MSTRQQLIEEDFVDVPADALSTQGGLKAAEQALRHHRAARDVLVGLSLEELEREGWSQCPWECGDAQRPPRPTKGGRHHRVGVLAPCDEASDPIGVCVDPRQEAFVGKQGRVQRP